MNVSYKREMRHNYLILEAAEGQEENFELRMLTENMIEGLLRLRVRQEEKGRYYYYEITSKQPLNRLLEFKEIKKEELRKLIIGIGAILHRIEDYLLQEANIVLEPEYIYIEPESYQVWLCYLPGYQKSFPSAMEKLLQYLLKKTDHKDNDTVVLAYRLYQESQKDYYGIRDLLKVVRESQQGTLKDLSFPFNNKEEQYLEKCKDETGNKELDFLPEKNLQGRDNENQEKILWERKVREKRGGEEKYTKEKSRKKKYQKENDQEERPGEKWALRSDKPEEFQKKDSGMAEIVKGLVGLLVMLILGPIILWFLTGTEGVRRYGMFMAAADIGMALGGLIYLWKKKRISSMNQEKSEVKRRKKWRMTFDDDLMEDMELGEVGEAGVRDTGDFCQKEWEQGNQEGEKCDDDEYKNTVLLAETSSEHGSAHMLKSLIPAVQDIPVPYFPFIIGKQEGIVDYVLKKETVSRLHLRIDEEKGNYKVTDLNSSNGTIIGEHGLEANESYPLCSGDKLMIADVPFIFY